MFVLLLLLLILPLRADAFFGASALMMALSAPSFPLDGVPSATFAYSLRKLRTAYVGSAVNIRRASDGTTTDIGFDAAGNFNSAAFNSFCNATTCFKTRWYDQSGNGLDCVQATAAKQLQVTLSSLGGRASLVGTGSTGSRYCAVPANSLLDFTGAGHTVLYELQYTAANDGGGTAGGRGDALEVISHFNPTGFFPGWASDAGDTSRAGATFVFTANTSASTSDGTFGHLTAINDGTPHFAGWSFASGAMKIYQDTLNYTSATTFNTPTTTGQQMTVLAANDTPIDDFFSGNLAELYGWATTLTPAQVASLQANAAGYY